jgi:hypothetical protein
MKYKAKIMKTLLGPLKETGKLLCLWKELIGAKGRKLSLLI